MYVQLPGSIAIKLIGPVDDVSPIGNWTGNTATTVVFQARNSEDREAGWRDAQNSQVPRHSTRRYLHLLLRPPWGLSTDCGIFMRYLRRSKGNVPGCLSQRVQNCRIGLLSLPLQGFSTRFLKPDNSAAIAAIAATDSRH